MLRLVMIALSSLSLLLASPLAPNPDTVGTNAGPCSLPGWSGIKHLFIFGDSYTATGFVTTGTQPSPANPFGNPTYPGYTSSNGPNWIDFLATTYNKSLVEVVNLAWAGATVDSSLVAPYETSVHSLKQQVEQDYLPRYGGSLSVRPWTAQDTLFGIWIGINDVGNTYYENNVTDINTAIFNVYTGLVDELYRSGARNFLFINVPPTEKAPLIANTTDWAITHAAADLADFNSRMASLANNLTETYSSTRATVFDSNALFNQILTNPCTLPQTCALKNTTGFCDAYQTGTADIDTYVADCGVPVDEYFWLNNLHPTFRVHNATAAKVAAQLASESCFVPQLPLY